MLTRSLSIVWLLALALGAAGCASTADHKAAREAAKADHEARERQMTEYNDAVRKVKAQARARLATPITESSPRPPDPHAGVTKWKIAVLVIKTSAEMAASGNHHIKKLIAFDGLTGTGFVAGKRAEQLCRELGRTICTAVVVWPDHENMYFEYGEEPTSRSHLNKTQMAYGYGPTKWHAEDLCWTQNIECVPQFGGLPASESTSHHSKPLKQRPKPGIVTRNP